MEFEWDQGKELSNRKKYGLGFQNASRVFDDPNHQVSYDGIVDYEERWRVTGLIKGFAVAVMAYTNRDQESVETIRIISARRATRKERNDYERNC